MAGGLLVNASEEFGETVRAARLARRMPNGKPWTQEYLAELAGIDQGTVSAVERGRGEPTPLTIRRLAGAFGQEPYRWMQLAGLMPARPDDEVARRLVLVALGGDEEYDAERIVAYVESRPGQRFQEQLREAKQLRPYPAYVEFCLNIFRAWESNSDLGVAGFRLGQGSGTSGA